MEYELQKFLEKAEAVHVAELQGIRDGRRLGTLQDLGMFLGPESAPHLRTARVCEIISVEVWESRSLAIHSAQRTLEPKPAESKSTINQTNITL